MTVCKIKTDAVKSMLEASRKLDNLATLSSSTKLLDQRLGDFLVVKVDVHHQTNGERHA